MRILFDSRQTQYKTPFGTLRTGECCVLQIRIPTEVGASGVRLMLENSEHAVCAELPFSFASRGEDGYELVAVNLVRELSQKGVKSENSLCESRDEALKYAKERGIKKLFVISRDGVSEEEL